MDIWVVTIPFTVISNVAMNVWVSVFVWSCGFHFSWFMPRNGLGGPNDNSAYCQTVSQGDFAILHPTKKVYEFQFLPTLANVC